MNETGSKMRSNMERVLRAMDVIPPFDEDRLTQPLAAGPVGGQKPSPRIQPWRRSQEPIAVRGQTAPPSPSSGAPGHIPTLDLGEKILAEQRRMTARKRKAPSRTAPEVDRVQPPVVSLRAERAVELSAQDAAQLERLVAEIVARDIDRLCTGPVRAIA